VGVAASRLHLWRQRTPEGRKIMTMHRQRTPLFASTSSHPGFVPMQLNSHGSCQRTVVAPFQSEVIASGLSSATGTTQTVAVPLAALSSCYMAFPGKWTPQSLLAAWSLPALAQPHGHGDGSPRRPAASPHVVNKQSCYDGICSEGQQKMTSKVSRLSSQASTVANPVCTPESPKLQQMQAPFAPPQEGSQALTAASTGCTPRDVVHDLTMDFGGTCRGLPEKTADLVRRFASEASTDVPDFRCSSKASLESADAVHLHKGSLRLHNQFLAEQLQLQQKMVQLLLKQLEKEQERRHSLEDALLESCSCSCPCCTTDKRPLTCDSGAGQ